jgi:hypothetical protein
VIDSPFRARLSRAWHGALVLGVAASLVIQIVLAVIGGGDAAPALGTRLVRLASYFTIQSNVLVLVTAVAIVLRPDTDGRWWRVLRLDAVLGILITGIVYATVLSGLNDPQGAAAFSNAGLHYFAPWWALAGWLLFGPRPRIDRRTLGWAVLWPVLWIGYTLAHGAATGWYPYPFTDVAELGYRTVLVNLAVILLITVALATLLRTLDRRLPPTAPGAGPVAPVVVSPRAAPPGPGSAISLRAAASTAPPSPAAAGAASPRAAPPSLGSAASLRAAAPTASPSPAEAGAASPGAVSPTEAASGGAAQSTAASPEAAPPEAGRPLPAVGRLRRRSAAAPARAPSPPPPRDPSAGRW